MDKIIEAKKEALAYLEDQERESMLRQQQMERESARKKEDALKWLSTLSKASAHDYSVWLDGYIRQGGKITHPYRYDMPMNFYIATADIKVTALYGSDSANIIAPPRINVDGSDIGHNNIFHMDGFEPSNKLWVPWYLNT